MPKFPIKKGFYGFETDDADFLTPDSTNPYKASASDVGYNARWDDDAGTKNYAGSGINGADDLAEFLAPSWTGDRDAPHNALGRLTDDDSGMGSGNKLTGGGGPLSKSYGVGDGDPRYAPKNIGTKAIHNPKGSAGGVPRAGRRGR